MSVDTADVVVQLKKTNSLLEKILESNTIKTGTPVFVEGCEGPPSEEYKDNGSLGNVWRVEDAKSGPTVIDAMNRIDELEEWITKFMSIDKNTK